jgi:hypothetical protein
VQGSGGSGAWYAPRMERLVETASGLRHLRWAREILATLEVHHEHNGGLSDDDRDKVLLAVVELQGRITELSAVVKAYRDFLERDRTRFRGMIRVGRYLEETARGAEEKSEAQAISAGFAEVFAEMEARERTPRKRALREAIRRMRAGLEAMDARLAARLGGELVESLYPALADGGTRVADAPDDDDDASG